MKNFKHVWFIGLKDLKIFVSDRAALFFSILFPFMLIVLFNFVLGGAFNEDARLEIHMATQETSGMSLQILAGMETKDPSLAQPGEPVIIWDKDYAAVKQQVDAEKLNGFLAFPADFTQSIMAGTPVNLEVYVQAGATSLRAALNGVANAIASRFVEDTVIIHSTAQLMGEAGATPQEIQAAIAKITAGLMSGSTPAGNTPEASTPFLTVVTENVGAVREINPSNFVIPGYLVMFVFFAAALSAASIVQEREKHTLERLLSTSVTREAILGGIYLGAVIRGLIQVVIFWGFGIIAFKVDMGLAPGAVILLSVLMALMSAAFSLMLATLVRTVRSASSLGVLTSLLLAPLGGCWWPLFLYPPWLQNIAKISPHAWATDGFNKLLIYGATLGDVWPSMVALVVFGVIFAGIAIWRFRAAAN
jgi:ABC-2 type transport system permease protein